MCFLHIRVSVFFVEVFFVFLDLSLILFVWFSEVKFFRVQGHKFSNSVGKLGQCSTTYIFEITFTQPSVNAALT